MKKKITKKLSSRSGESIAEVLIALLISVLAVLMLTGMVDTSCRVVEKSTKKMHEYYEKTNPSSESQGLVTVKNGGTPVAQFHIKGKSSKGEVIYYVPDVSALSGS